MQWRTRENGFTRPLNILQLLTWLVYFANVTYFYVFIIMMHSWVFIIVTGLVYLLTSIFVFKYAVTTMKINPIDQVVVDERKCRSENVSFAKNEYEFYCAICDTHVSNHSKHCGKCNK